jgi:hypothetical protein
MNIVNHSSLKRKTYFSNGLLDLLDVSVDAELDYEQTIIEAGVSYEIARFPGDPGSIKDDFGGSIS